MLLDVAFEASVSRGSPVQEADGVVCVSHTIGVEVHQTDSRMHGIAQIWPMNNREGLIKIGMMASCPEVGVWSRLFVWTSRVNFLSSGV